MSWWMVLIVLFIGWLLVFVEVFFIPGTMLLAITGTITMIGGIVISFNTFGPAGGLLALFGSAVFTIISLVIGYKSGLLKGLTLRTTQSGKANQIDESKIKVGDAGVAQSKISFIGKGLFNDQVFEVQSMGEYIEQGTPIEVTKISLNKIFIKPKK